VSKWDESRTREQALRRRARARGMTFTKGYALSCWFLFDQDHRARKATVFYSLDEASAVLSADDTEAARRHGQ
jgi:hypothetical protein